jgi:uncharacterized SAM-binding protein YcdF (DUF218 family)
MVFFLRKFIEALLLPIGFSGFLVVVGVILRRRWICLAGVATLYIFSTGIVGTLILRPLEHTYAPSTVAAAPVADAIVVLSGSIVRGVNLPGVQWGQSSNRYFAGFDLAMAGKAKYLIFTAAHTDDAQGLSQGELLRQVAIRQGIEADRTMVTSAVLTTEDEARVVAQIPGVHSVLLVTSAFHMPRAVLLFQRRGLLVSPFPTDQRVWNRSYLLSSSFIPDSGGMDRSDAALREYYGLAVYRLLGWFGKP